MNARVKELMPKPWVSPYPDREMYSKEQMEHFAEQIIKQCIEIAEREPTPQNLNYKPSERFVESLKLHFRIK